MSTSGSSGTPSLLDTSVAVAFVVQDHEHHEQTFDLLTDRALGLSGHAAFETFSVLTRLPTPARLAPAAAQELITANFPHSRYLGSRATANLLVQLARHGIAGGSVYDALVAATAKEHDLVLVTRDQRALATYRAVGAHVEVIG